MVCQRCLVLQIPFSLLEFLREGSEGPRRIFAISANLIKISTARSVKDWLSNLEGNVISIFNAAR